MALQLTVSYKGLTLTNAYHRIYHVSGSKVGGLNVHIGVQTAVGEDAIYKVESHIPADQITYGPAAGDHLAQCYTYLKTQTAVGGQIDYTTATDV